MLLLNIISKFWFSKQVKITIIHFHYSPETTLKLLYEDYCLRDLQLIIDALWEHIPTSNFSRSYRVKLGESQVEIGTQIPLGDEHSDRATAILGRVFPKYCCIK